MPRTPFRKLLKHRVVLTMQRVLGRSGGDFHAWLGPATSGECSVPFFACGEPTRPAIGTRPSRERSTRSLAAAPSRLVEAPSRRFKNVQVEVTSRCNLRCRTCLYASFEPQWKSQDLSPWAFERILEVAHRCDSLHLQGWGETLLRDDVPDLICRAKRCGSRVTLSSNGTLPSCAGDGELVEAGLDSMAFSFAGASAEWHDSLRGEGTFSAAEASVLRFSQVRGAGRFPPLLLNYLLTPANIPALERAVALCARLGADGIVPTHMVHVSTREQDKLVAYDRNLPFRWSFAKSRFSALLRRVSLVLPRLTGAVVPVCEKNPLESFFVGSDGSVSPCVYLNPPLQGEFPRVFRGRETTTSRVVMGNLHDSTIDEIWDSAAYISFREIFRARVKVHDTLLSGVTPDFDGMARLDRSVARLRELYAEELAAPEPCRVCGQLYGL
ncbi:MAG: radical SAM/SPASM domain-containing protein [Thermodesulfobacteriota bacterium]